MATMNLTLNVDDALRARAEELASASGMTVAEFVERLLAVVVQQPLARNDLPPITRRLAGALPPMTRQEADRILDEERMKKYGGR